MSSTTDPEPAYASPEWYARMRQSDASTDLSRLTIYHHGFKLGAQGQLMFAPISFSSAQPLLILDIGTADGLWMREVSSSIPLAQNGEKHRFLGTDLNESFFPSNEQRTGWENITYVKQDIKSETFPAELEELRGKVDLLNLRMILLAAGSSDAQRACLIRHLALLKPGGVVQIGDCDRICPTSEEVNPYYHQMFKCINAACLQGGAAPWEAVKMKGWLEEAGLEDVEERRVMRPVGKKVEGEEEEVGWLKEASVKADLVIGRGFAGAAKRLPAEQKPLDDEALDALEGNLEKELNETGALFPMRFIWGRKPL